MLPGWRLWLWCGATVVVCRVGGGGRAAFFFSTATMDFPSSRPPYALLSAADYNIGEGGGGSLTIYYKSVRA